MRKESPVATGSGGYNVIRSDSSTASWLLREFKCSTSIHGKSRLPTAEPRWIRPYSQALFWPF